MVRIELLLGLVFRLAMADPTAPPVKAGCSRFPDQKHPAFTRGAVASKPNAFAGLRDLRVLRGRRFGLYLCPLRHLWIAVAVRFGRLNCPPR